MLETEDGRVIPDIPIKQEDFTHLIVLDACRFDVFEDCIQAFPYDGELIPVDSKAKSLESFYDANFEEKREDWLMITSNSKVPDRFGYKFDASSYDEYLSDHGVVFPEVLKNVSFGVMRAIDHKKVVLQLSQPSLPFISQSGIQLQDREGIGYNSEQAYQKLNEYGKERGWREIRECYKQSLLETLLEIEQFINRSKGFGESSLRKPKKYVITSTCSELLGEEIVVEEAETEEEEPETEEIYGHGIEDLSMLRIVPWYEIEVVE